MLASDDNGVTFRRSLRIDPGGAGYTSLQCGLPAPEDCAALGGRRAFWGRWGGETFSRVCKIAHYYEVVRATPKCSRANSKVPGSECCQMWALCHIGMTAPPRPWYVCPLPRQPPAGAILYNNEGYARGKGGSDLVFVRFRSSDVR